MVITALFTNMFWCTHLVSPQVNVSPLDQTIPEGKKSNISCKATGVPKPTLTWEFNDGDLPSGAIVNDTDGGSFLQLPIVAKGMEGTYTCTASNKASEATSSATLRVLGNASLTFMRLIMSSIILLLLLLLFCICDLLSIPMQA